MKFFKALYDYRELLKTSISKDVRGKYKNSVLGILWSFLNPIITNCSICISVSINYEK